MAEGDPADSKPHDHERHDHKDQENTEMPPRVPGAALDHAADQSLSTSATEPSMNGEKERKSVDIATACEPAENPKLWRPLSLFRRIIFIFLIVFLACIVSLETIYRMSEHFQGLVSTTPDRHYLWTYGPTALFTVVAASWTRVDYRLQQCAPWVSLSKGTSPASKLVLLDYVGSFQPMVIYQAIREKHFDVSLSKVLSYSLSLLIVVSTGLMQLTPVVVRNDHFEVQSLDSFADVPLPDIDPNAARPLSLAWGFQRLNLTFPWGTTDKIAFQTFNTSLVAPQSTGVEVVVDGLTIEWECENASLSKHSWTNEAVERGTAIGTFDIVTDSCRVIDNEVRVSPYSLVDATNTFQSGHCANLPSADGYRVILMVARTNATASEYMDSMNFSIFSSFQKLCKPRYAINPYRLVASLSPSASGQHFSAPSLSIARSINRTLAHVPIANLSEIFFYTTEFNNFQGVSEVSNSNLGSSRVLSKGRKTSGSAADQNFTIGNGYAWSYVSAVYNLGESQTGEWLGKDQPLYERLCWSTYQTFLVQLAKEQMLRLEPMTIKGSVWVNVDRLLVQSFTTRSMEAILGVMTVLVILILLLAPSQGVAPRDPGSLVGMGAIMSAERKRLQDSSIADRTQSSRTVQNDSICSESLPEGMIPVSVMIINESRNLASRQGVDSSTNLNKAWYRRPLVSRLSLIVSLIIVCSVIAALEALLQISSRRHGLVDVNQASYVRYTWSLIPAAFTTGICFYFSVVNYAACVFAPLAALKNGADYRTSMAINFLAKISIQTLWTSIRIREAAVFFSASAALVGTLLTIAMSGVYTTAVTPFRQTVMFRQGHNLTNQYPNSTTDASTNHGALIAGIILNAQLGYPAWTYEDLAFPPLYFDPNTPNLSAIRSSNGTVRAKVQAIQSKLSCRLFGIEELLYDNVSQLYGVPTSGCGDWPTEWLLLSVIDSHVTFAQNDVAGYYLQYPSLHSCTYLNYAWGSTDATNITDMTVLRCSEEIGVVDTDVTFVLPQFLVAETPPPVPDESTLREFETSYFDPDYDNLPTPGSSPPGYEMDAFFQQLTGKNERFSMPADWLKDKGRIDDVRSAIMKLHGIIRAQQYAGENMGVPGTTNYSSGERTHVGMATYGSRFRLMYNAPSTRILEGLLLVIAICTLVIIFTIRTKEIVPVSPTSIAGTAQLLVDSNVLVKFPEGAERMSDEKLAEMLEKYRFKLGWFRPDGRTSPGDTVGAGKEGEAVGEVLKYGIYIVEGDIHDGTDANDDGEGKDASALEKWHSHSPVEIQNGEDSEARKDNLSDTVIHNVMRSNDEEEENDERREEEHPQIEIQSREQGDARNAKRDGTQMNDEGVEASQPGDVEEEVQSRNHRDAERDDTLANGEGGEKRDHN